MSKGFQKRCLSGKNNNPLSASNPLWSGPEWGSLVFLSVLAGGNSYSIRRRIVISNERILYDQEQRRNLKSMVLCVCCVYNNIFSYLPSLRHAFLWRYDGGKKGIFFRGQPKVNQHPIFRSLGISSSLDNVFSFAVFAERA